MKRTLVILVFFALLLGAAFGARIAWKEYHLIPQARQAVLSGLKEPANTQFRNETYHPESQLICGEVRTKNDAANAFLRFVSAATGGYAIEGDVVSHWPQAEPAQRQSAMLRVRVEGMGKGKGDIGEAEAYKIVDQAAFEQAWVSSCPSGG